MMAAASAEWLGRFRMETAGIHAEAGLVAAVVGLALAGFGWSLYRPCLILSGMVVGVAVGTALAYAIGIDPLYPALAVGLLFALVAVPLVKVAVVLSSGTAGTLLAAGLVQNTPWNEVTRGSVMAFAFVACAALSLVLFRLMVTFAFAVQGSALACAGALTALGEWSPAAADWICARAWVMWVAFYGLFFVGMVVQIRGGRRLDERRELKTSVSRARAKVRKKYGRASK